MPYRDEDGHFISREEAERRGILPDDVAGEVANEEETQADPAEFGEAQRGEAQPVMVDTGRGNVEEVQPGAPFVSTLEMLADRAHYGGYYRIFLNGSEVVNPEDAPETIESGMRLAITSYDKVGWGLQAGVWVNHRS